MTGTEASPPLVTVAIPLYRSRRFFDVIVENIETLDYPNLEILIGDRHLADDTVDRLRERFRDDTRIRFVTATDELSWVAHYNLLLAAGRGKYFLWMPHDDSYPAGYVGTLVARLEETPDSVLAFGRMQTASIEGEPAPTYPPPPMTPTEAWSVRSALRLHLCWNLGIGIRGVFRRSTLVDAGLWIRDMPGGAKADGCWMFGVALLGRFEYAPDTGCLKRFYVGSTHERWEAVPHGQESRLCTSYLRDYGPAGRERVLALAVLWSAASLNFGAFVINRVAGRQLIGPNPMRRVFLHLLKGPERARVRASPRRNRNSTES